jgi:hypothetical protein
MGVFENDILYCPKQNEDISEGRSNRDVKVRIHAIEVFVHIPEWIQDLMERLVSILK